jgi:microcystin-dependent protein
MSSDEGRSYDPQKDAQAQEPLSANEVKLVTRLFGDPFAFPLEFKAWLRGWLEEQYPRLGALGSPGASGASGNFVPPAGSILDFGGDAAPQGYVLCDGAEYDKTQANYGRLFDAIGTRYGSSGGNMFNVPDFQGRVAVMKGTRAEIDSLADSDGLALVSRSPNHHHLTGREVVSLTPGGTGYNIIGAAVTIDRPTTGGPPTDAPAYLVVNKIISLGA